MSQFHHSFIARVIDLYGLELDGYQVDNLVVTWLQKYDPAWIVKAIVESLYRGRYKIKSIDNILKDWQRLGKPRHNFTPDYEREILQNLPDPSQLATTPILPIPSFPVASGSLLEPPHANNQFSSDRIQDVDSDNLDPEESAPFGRHLHSNTTEPAAGLAVVDVVEHLPAASTIEPDRDEAAGSVLSSASELLEHHGDRIGVVSDLPQRESQVDESAQRIDHQPVNHHLFATLKAIVDPNYQRHTSVDRPVCLPLYVVNPNSDRIKQFKLSIETIGEEQYR